MSKVEEVIEGEFEEVCDTAVVVAEKESGIKKIIGKAKKHKGKIVTGVVAALALGVGYAIGSKNAGSDSADEACAYDSDEEEETYENEM